MHIRVYLYAWGEDLTRMSMGTAVQYLVGIRHKHMHMCMCMYTCVPLTLRHGGDGGRIQMQPQHVRTGAAAAAVLGL